MNAHHLPHVKPPRTRSCQQKIKPEPLKSFDIYWHKSGHPVQLVEFYPLRREENADTGQVNFVPSGERIWLLSHKWCGCDDLLPTDTLPACYGSMLEGKNARFLAEIANAEAATINTDGARKAIAEFLQQ